MEFVLLTSIILSSIVNYYLVRKVVVSIENLPAPQVNVIVEPEIENVVENRIVEFEGIDYDRLETLISGLIAASQPVIVPQPTYIPAETELSTVYWSSPTFGDMVTTTNEAEIDGIHVRQFPAR